MWNAAVAVSLDIKLRRRSLDRGTITAGASKLIRPYRRLRSASSCRSSNATFFLCSSFTPADGVAWLTLSFPVGCGPAFGAGIVFFSLPTSFSECGVTPASGHAYSGFSSWTLTTPAEGVRVYRHGIYLLTYLLLLGTFAPLLYSCVFEWPHESLKSF
jgi:hypothetical protein